MVKLYEEIINEYPELIKYYSTIKDYHHNFFAFYDCCNKRNPGLLVKLWGDLTNGTDECANWNLEEHDIFL